MKGFPVAETLCCLGILLFLLFPILRTVPPSPGVSSSLPSDAEVEQADGLETYVSLRFSHPVERAEIQWGTFRFDTGGDVLGFTFDGVLPEQGVSMALEVEWPEGEGVPFTQITVEPEGQASQTVSFWGKPGVQTRRWYFSPGAAE